MRTIDNHPEDIFLSGWNLLLGASLIAAPWYFGFASELVAAWNAWGLGATVIVLALLALMQTSEWEEYVIAAAGFWACAAPWALGFQEVTAAAWAHVGFGVALIVSAGSELWRLREAPAANES